MKKIVKVINVQKDYEKEKRDGGTYQCTLFTYEDSGETRSMPLANAFLSKATGLATKLHALEAGTDVEITLEKKGMYWNLTDVDTPTQAGTSTGSTTARRTTTSSYATQDKSRQESIVFQNSMAHATAIILHNSGGKKVKVEDVLAMATTIAKVSVKPDLSTKSTATTSKVNTEADALVADEDIPFGS